MATETPAAGRPAEPDAPVPREGPGDPALTEIATALFHLRRVWAKPDLMKRIRAQTSAGPDGRPLQLSNLMVVNAVAALTAAAERPECAARRREVTVGAVAERLEIDPSTASRLVGHAIDAGLVSRRPSPIDARRANLGLTEAGRRVKRVSDRSRRVRPAAHPLRRRGRPGTGVFGRHRPHLRRGRRRLTPAGRPPPGTPGRPRHSTDHRPVRGGGQYSAGSFRAAGAVSRRCGGWRRA